MTICENGNVVTDLLDGLALESHQLDLLVRLGVIDHTDPEFDVNSVVGRLKAIKDCLDLLKSQNSIDFATVVAELQTIVSNTASLELNTDTLEALQQATTNAITAFDNAVAVRDLATSAKQLPDGHGVTVGNFPATYPNQHVQGLTDTELRASPVPVTTGLTQPTTPADTQPISAVSLPLPSGAATAAKQLPDNHQVTVSNQIAQPLTLAQYLAATPLAGANDLAISLGLIPGIRTVSETGFVMDGVSSTPTDIWGGADVALLSPGQQLWIAPTTARRHNIVSTSASDTSAGTGMRTVAVTGLTSWSTAEVTEIVTMNGLTNVLTVNAYVIINDMTMVTCGSAGPNVGRVTATAQTDGTLTVSMRPVSGRTTTTIYGIPSTKSIVFQRWDAFLNRESGASFVEFKFLVNLNPAVQASGWIEADRRSCAASGTSAAHFEIKPPPRVQGPAIFKVQATASKTGTSAGASYGFYLVDN